VTVASPAGQLVLCARRHGWTISGAPPSGRFADPIERTAHRDISGARIKEFVDSAPDLKALGLEPPGSGDQSSSATPRPPRSFSTSATARCQRRQAGCVHAWRGGVLRWTGRPFRASACRGRSGARRSCLGSTRDADNSEIGRHEQASLDRRRDLEGRRRRGGCGCVSRPPELAWQTFGQGVDQPSPRARHRAHQALLRGRVSVDATFYAGTPTRWLSWPAGPAPSGGRCQDQGDPGGSGLAGEAEAGHPLQPRSPPRTRKPAATAPVKK